MLLTPRMAYQRGVFGEGLFFCGPAGAIFRAEVFRQLGDGFPDERRRIRSSVLDARVQDRQRAAGVAADLSAYWLHPAQEFQSAKGPSGIRARAGLVWRALHETDCPLILDEREQAKRNRAYHTCRQADAQGPPPRPLGVRLEQHSGTRTWDRPTGCDTSGGLGATQSPALRSALTANSSFRAGPNSDRRMADKIA